MLLPCAICTSICRSVATICSALQFFRLAISGSFGSGQLSQSTRSKISQSGHVHVTDLRRHMALVGQDNAILPLSVAANIAYGQPDAAREDVVTAAEMADAAEFI